MQPRVLAALLLCSAAAAQPAFVVPSKANTTQPGLVYFDSAPQSYPFWALDTWPTSTARVQYVYDVADIPITTGTLTALAVRSRAGYTQVASTYSTQITMSMGPNGSTSPSSQFAANHGAPTGVFNGSINMPAAIGTTWPAPWQRPVPFAAPFPFNAALGRSLVVEFVTTAIPNQSIWWIEGYGAETGNSRTELYQPNCLHSGGQARLGWGWDAAGLVPGGALWFRMFDYPANAPHMANNVLFVSAGGLGSQVGPFTTPFDLNRLVPSQPNCQWAVDIVNALTVPMTYRQYVSYAHLELNAAVPIPSHASMRNRVLFTQNVALDFDAANNAVLYPSITIRWLIGTGDPVPVSVVRTTGPLNPLRTSGTIGRSEGASLQLLY